MVLILSQAGKRDSGVAIERGLYRGDYRLCGGRVGLSKAGEIDGETVETVPDFFLGLQNHCRW